MRPSPDAPPNAHDPLQSRETKRPTGPAVGLFMLQPTAKCGKALTSPDTPKTVKPPAKGEFSGRSTRLKIVVSPVRVRVAPFNAEGRMTGVDPLRLAADAGDPSGAGATVR